MFSFFFQKKNHLMFEFIKKLKRFFNRIIKVIPINFYIFFLEKRDLKNNKNKKILFIQTFPAAWPTVSKLYHHLSSSDNFQADVLLLPSNKFKTPSEKQRFYNSYFSITDKIPWIKFDDISNNLNDLSEILKYDFYFFNRPYLSEITTAVLHPKTLREKGRIVFMHYGYSLSTEYNKYWSNDRLIYYADIIFAENKTKYKSYRSSLTLRRLTNHVYIKYFGYPRFEDILKLEKSNLKKSLCVLWTPRWSFYNETPDNSTFLDYISFILDFFTNNQQLTLILRPHPLMFNNILSKGLMSELQVLELRKKFKENSNISIDESADFKNSVRQSEIIITDYTALLADYHVAGKHVIYTGNDSHFNFEGRIINSYNIQAANLESLKRELKRLIENWNDIDHPKVDSRIFDRYNFPSHNIIKFLNEKV